jgi:hypothetical protein
MKSRDEVLITIHHAKGRVYAPVTVCTGYSPYKLPKMVAAGKVKIPDFIALR